MLNPWRLRLLSQLDTLGTVRAVAQAANLSPSSVSQQLAVLEAETRTQLLERTGRRVRLTSAGLILARRARAILDQMDTVEAELRGFGEEPAGLVRLGAFQSAIHTIAVPAVTRLAREHPHLDVELLELEPHESMPALRVGDVDVIVTTTDFVELPLGPDLDLVPLATDPIVLVLPAEHPAAGRGAVDLAAYADEPWAFDLPQSYMANLTLRLCRDPGFEPRVVCRFSNYLMTAAARRGRAVDRAAARPGGRPPLSRRHPRARGPRDAHDHGGDPPRLTTSRGGPRRVGRAAAPSGPAAAGA